MSGSRWVQAVVCLVLGVAVGIAAVFALARTAAIAAPAGLFAWFKQAGSIEAGVFSWDLLVTYGLGVGLPAFIVALLAIKVFLELIKRISFVSFAIYRFIVAAAVYAVFM